MLRHPQCGILSRIISAFSALLVAAVCDVADAREPLAEADAAGRGDVDILVSWEPDAFQGRHKKDDWPNIMLYVNGRFVGFDEAGMKAVLERVRGLPDGASVVWAPNPEKWGGGSGSEEIPPEVKCPELWKEFMALRGKRGITYSTRAGANLRGTDRRELFEMWDPNPDVRFIEPAERRRPGDIVLSCWRGAEGGLIRYSVDGRATGRGPRGFYDTMQLLRTMPAGSRLRLDVQDGGDYRYFPLEFDELVRDRQFRCVVELDKKHWPKWYGRPAPCRWDWCNFLSEDAPPQEVIYRIDGKSVGMGDRGFDAVLAHLRTLPQGAHVEYPKYVIRGRGLPPREVREAFEARDLVPFARRRNELAEVIRQRGLVVERAERGPFGGAYLGYSYHNGWRIEPLLTVARIVRHDQRPSEAAAVLTWKQGPRPGKKAPAPPADYFINGEATGRGAAGFVAALARVEQVPDGSVVRIDPVHVATRGSFANAITIVGHRHFEFTYGIEPFREFLDLLIELAKRKRLTLELIPDEGERFQVENP